MTGSLGSGPPIRCGLSWRSDIGLTVIGIRPDPLRHRRRLPGVMPPSVENPDRGARLSAAEVGRLITLGLEQELLKRRALG